ncbi:unnamed protein product [Penicillium manginii]
MKGFMTLVASAAGVHALVNRGDSCCFHLTASGGASGPVGQLSDGQNRIGDNSLSPADFCIDSNGAITDGNGRGCILTRATPTPGFSVGSNGQLEFAGSANFVACETGDNGGLNIYSTLSNALSQCKTINLMADSCSGSQSPPPTPQPNNGCGPILSSGNFEFPHLIIPIDSSSPDTAFGTSFNGTVTSTISSIFNFDIPQSDSGKTCSLVFLFPNKADLQTSSFSFSGDGKIDVAKLASVATSQTNFNNAPSVAEDLGYITISPGNSFVISTFSCPAGQAISFEMKNAGSTDLDFFQDFNPAPIGLFITVC